MTLYVYSTLATELFGQSKNYNDSKSYRLDSIFEKASLSAKEKEEYYKAIADYCDYLNEVGHVLVLKTQSYQEAQVQLLLLDSDRKLKTELYKKVLENNPELQKLLS